jgi:hypothetical protein
MEMSNDELSRRVVKFVEDVAAIKGKKLKKKELKPIDEELIMAALCAYAMAAPSCMCTQYPLEDLKAGMAAAIRVVYAVFEANRICALLPAADRIKIESSSHGDHVILDGDPLGIRSENFHCLRNAEIYRIGLIEMLTAREVTANAP